MSSTTSRSYHYATLDVFTQERYSGNPLAVVELSEADDLSTQQLQLIAREFNFSETVFLYRREDELEGSNRHWRIRIFLTTAEVPFAGHPVVGTAYHIKSRILKDQYSGVLRLTCPAGNVDFTVNGEAPSVTAQVPHDFHLHSSQPTTEQVLELQPDLKAEDLLDVHVASPVKGMNFLLAELRDLQGLRSVRPRGIAASLSLDQGWDHGFVGTAYYVKTGEESGTQQYQTRMIESSLEDPATGSMSCGLAAFLTLNSGKGSERFQFTQGVEMGRKSDIGVAVTLNEGLSELETLTLSGTAVHVMRGVLEL